MKIKVDINAKKVMKARGLYGDNRVQKHLASEVKRLSDPYVPMHTGHLKNSAVIANDGSSITYPGPYAHYQYAGKVMGPNYQDKDGNWHSGKAPKHYTGEDLTYSGGGMRGPQWEKRMLADKKDDLCQSVNNYIKRMK